MTDEEAARNTAIHDAVGWDDRKTLSDLWQDYAPLPDEGLSERVYSALIAVAAWGAGRAYDDVIPAAGARNIE